MFLTNEDYEGLTQVQLILARIIKNAVMSELEEEHEQKFNKSLIYEKDDCVTYAPPLEEDKIGFFEITEQEILKMPKTIRKYFLFKGQRIHYRIRQDERYTKSLEVRYAKKPFNNPPISVSAPTLSELRAKFIDKLNNYTVQENKSLPSVPKIFDGFALFWFEKFHKRKVGERTYDHDIKLYYRHIKEKFGKLAVKDVNAVMLQEFLDNAPGTGKTAKDLYSIINQILVCAVKHGLIKLNPLGMCILDAYDQDHGVALTLDEERSLDTAFKGSEWELPFAIVRFTGLRPCEYETAVIDGNFIKAQNGKRKDGKIEYKRIPITPMLRPYIQGVDNLKMPKSRVLNNRFKKVLPEHKLYDMRTTFQTRCSECGINETVIGLFMGNSIGKLKEAYTDFPDEFLIKEAEKFKY